MDPSSRDSLVWSPLVAIVGLSILTYIVSNARWRTRSHGRPLPPGPKCLPFIGNIFHMRKTELWKAHRELCKTYGKHDLHTVGRSLRALSQVISYTPQSSGKAL